MKVQHIQQNINFEAKKRYIDTDAQYYLEKLLRKMDKEIEYNEFSFAHKKTTRLELFNHNKDKKLAELIDGRDNYKKLPKDKDIFGTTFLTIGKTELSIDNKSGEILAYSKPFYKTWNNILKNIRNTLLDFNNCYYTTFVKKNCFWFKMF